MVANRQFVRGSDTKYLDSRYSAYVCRDEKATQWVFDEVFDEVTLSS